MILVPYLWLRLIKHSGKEEESQKKLLSKKENDHKLISKREILVHEDTWNRKHFTCIHIGWCQVVNRAQVCNQASALLVFVQHELSLR